MSLKPEYNTEELKKRLTPQQYAVVANEGTERAFTGALYNHHEDGIYRCIVCETPLFESKSKYDSGSGWPSFFDAWQEHLDSKIDTKLGVARTEITCKRCGAHLGHVFPDGPQETTGLRYCVNSASLDFLKTEES